MLLPLLLCLSGTASAQMQPGPTSIAPAPSDSLPAPATPPATGGDLPSSLPDARLHSLATHSLTWKLLPLLGGTLGFALGTALHQRAVSQEARRWPSANTGFVTLWLGSLLALLVFMAPVVGLFTYWAFSTTSTAQLMRQQGATPYLWVVLSTVLPLVAWAGTSLAPTSGRSRA